MGHWVTLDDDQHVYISDGGKVLATRGAISSAAGGKERGRALAGRSKAAIGKALGKAKKREASYTVKAKQPIDKEGRYYPGGTTAVERDAMKRAAALREQRAAQQSPATARAIEHARAAAAERPKTIADAKQTGREELIHGLHNWEPKTRTMQRFKDMGRKRKVAEEYIRDRLAEPTNRIVGGMLGGQRAGQAKINAAGRKIAAAAEEARKARVAKWNYPH